MNATDTQNISTEHAMQRIVQILFALNHAYFPGWKRALAHVETFEVKPADCGRRILEAIRLGACAETIPDSYAAWTALVDELITMHAARGASS
jgi:hypothetical protein